MRHIALLLLLIAAPLFAAEPDRVQLVRDAQLRSHLRVAADDGKVAVGDIFRGVSRMNGYDDSELRDAIPAGKISLTNKGIRWTMDKFNWIMQPCVRCEVKTISQQPHSLNVTVDRVSARDWINDCKAQLRSTWNRFDCRRETPSYGMELLGDVDPAAARDLVVLIHGLNSRPEDLVSLVPIVRGEDLVPVCFRYPNDQPIDASAKLLSEALKKLGQDYPSSEIRLITHSMGGLVARGALEMDELDPGNVTQLIMIAPPNQGSGLAGVASFMDCYECWTSADCRKAGVLVESVSDGLGEATADLKPNSVFLDRINRMPRNPHVRYTILLGTKAPMEMAEMKRLRTTVRNCSDGNRFLRFASSKVNRCLANLDEVVDGKGDGVVSVQRGRLDGVRDVVELPFGHGSVLNGSLKSSKEVHHVIQHRLRHLAR